MTNESEKQRTVLIQIISEQTLPNLACVKAIRPDKIWSLYTESEKMKKKARIIEAFISKYALCPNLRMQAIRNPSPSIKEICEIVEALIREEKREDPSVRLIVNYTGGRKPMSIGAYYAARELGVEAIYTEDGKTISGGENNEPFQVVPDFSIEEMLDAQGYEEHTSAAITENRLKLAEEILNLRKANLHDQPPFVFYPPEKEKEWNLCCLAPKEREKFMGGLNQVREYFQKVIEFSNQENGCYEAALRLCEQENWLVGSSGKYEISENLLNTDETSRDIHAKLSFANNFLNGGWWEILVARTLQNKFGEKNVLWSLRPKPGHHRYANPQNSQENHGKNEDDVLAVYKNRLYVVSCKAGRSQKKFAETLGQLFSRAQSLGGHQAIPIFAYTHLDQLKKEHLAYGKLLGIRFIGPKNNSTPDASGNA